MAQLSSIEWTDATWNPVTGCSKISTGCKHCYAERMAKRLQAMGQANYAAGFAVTMHDHTLEAPLRWRAPRNIFVNSMSDLFHEHVPETFIQRVFATMQSASWHRFQVLTKRAGRLAQLSKRLSWPSNVWMGVTVETAKYASRMDHLRKTDAALKFLSLEPLVEPLPHLDLKGIGWVILGGESGPGARPIEEAWVLDIRDQCVAAKVPFFFKQWGGVRKKAAGRMLEGRTWDQMPPIATVGVSQASAARRLG